MEDKDLTGKHFGFLEVIKRDDSCKYKRGLAKWVCHCNCDAPTCSKIISVTTHNLIKRKQKSCGKRAINLIGTKSGSLEVMSFAGKSLSGLILWNCKCSCGEANCKKEIILPAEKIVKNRSVTCGARQESKDLTGMIFGNLRAMECTDNNRNSKSRWKCECSCGSPTCRKIIFVESKALLSGITASCGAKTIDLQGRIFGDLEIVRFSGLNKNNKALWIASCHCGRKFCKNEIEVMSQELLNGRKTNCGRGARWNGKWFRSRYEAITAMALTHLNIEYEYEPKIFKLNIKKSLVGYIPDFYIPQYNLWLEMKGFLRPLSLEKFLIFSETHHTKMLFGNDLQILCGGTTLHQLYKAWQDGGEECFKLIGSLLQSNKSTQDAIRLLQ